MNEPPTNTLDAIQREVQSLKLDDSLLFINHVLGVSRDFTTDPQLKSSIQSARPGILPHVEHFLAKQLLLHASNLGPRVLNWDLHQRLSSLCLNLDDPINHDPEWSGRDPTGFFERVMSHQFDPNRRNAHQKMGLALGLFRDVGAVDWPVQFDLRQEIEAELGTSIDNFMKLGFVTFALRSAKHEGNPCLGTFTPMMLAESFAQGIAVCVPEVWTPFLDRVSCGVDEFRKIAGEPEYQVDDQLFEQFGFNPLWRFPIIQLGDSRYLAVDPELVIERMTFGLFYDLFDRNRTEFSARFGFAFEKFVGQLLARIVPKEKLWSASEWEQAQRQNTNRTKMGDWAVVADKSTVLIECKSLRPSLRLRTYGYDDSIQSLAERLASAVEQLSKHSIHIQEGQWNSAGLQSRPIVGLIISYGRFYTVNGPMMRKNVEQILNQRAVTSIPYVVLSLEEFDMVLRIVEQGHAFDDVIHSLANQNETFVPLNIYEQILKECAVSSHTVRIARQLVGTITAKKPPDDIPLAI